MDNAQTNSLSLSLDESCEVVLLEGRKGKEGGAHISNDLAYKLARIVRAALATGIVRIDTGAA